MKSESRSYGNNITAVMYHDRGVALVVVSPLPNGEPDNSEEHYASWLDMVSDLRREGYIVGPDLEPAHTLTLPLAPCQTGMMVGDWDLHTVYKRFDHFSLVDVEAEFAW